jgi:hypothetical protein
LLSISFCKSYTSPGGFGVACWEGGILNKGYSSSTVAINDNNITGIDLSAKIDTVFTLQLIGGSIPLVKFDVSLNLRL